jgi:hypothetical protein
VADALRQYDYGGYIEATVYDLDDEVVDLSTATALHFVFQRPDDVIVSKTASVVTDGTDGKMRYLFADGDLALSGIWEYQVVLVFSGAEFYSDLGTFFVQRALVRF